MQRDSGKNISLFFSIIALVEIYLTYPTKETFHRCSNAGSVKDGVCAALWRKSRTPLAFSTRILICFLEVEAEFISQNATLEICFKTGTHPIWPGQAAASLSLGFQFPGTFARPVYPTRFGGKRGFPSWERSCMLPSLPTPRPTAQRESQEARPRWGPGARCARRLPSGRREQALARPLGWKCGLDSAPFSPRLVGHKSNCSGSLPALGDRDCGARPPAPSSQPSGRWSALRSLAAGSEGEGSRSYPGLLAGGAHAWVSPLRPSRKTFFKKS